MTALAFPPKLAKSLQPNNRQLWSPPESGLSCRREVEFLATSPPLLSFRDCFIITEEATGIVKPNIWLGEKFLPLVDPDHRMLEAPSFNIDQQGREQTLQSCQNS